MTSSDLVNRSDIELQHFIDMLGENPSDEELLQAAKRLRQQKVDKALDKTIEAASFDRESVAEDYVVERRRANTRRAYRQALNRFFNWLDKKRMHLLLVQRADVIRFRNWLEERFSANTVRHTITVVQSFFSYLEAEGHVAHNPAVRIPQPNREWKKRVRGEGTEPIMSEGEYLEIIEALEVRKRERGRHISVKRRRESAKRILPAVQFMALYGLRIGDLPFVKLTGSGFSYTSKGERELRRTSTETWDIIEGQHLIKRIPKQPFADLKPGTIQKRFHDLTRQLAINERIRHDYSVHDLRHLFARRIYEQSKDIYTVSRFLGHKSIKVTEIYLQQIGLTN